MFLTNLSTFRPKDRTSFPGRLNRSSSHHRQEHQLILAVDVVVAVADVDVVVVVIVVVVVVIVVVAITVCV